MITSLHLQNFKGFKELRIGDIGRVTLLSGLNNIGKTALLEALFLFYDTGNPGLLFRHMGWRGLNNANFDIDSLFAPLFYDFNTENIIKIEVQDGLSRGSLKIQKNSSYQSKPIILDMKEGQNTPAQGQTSFNALAPFALALHYEMSNGQKEDVSLVLSQTPGNTRIALDPAPTTIFPNDMQHLVTMLPLNLNVDPHEENVRFGKVDVARKTDRILEFLQVLEPKLQGLSSVMLPSGPIIHADVEGISRKIPISFLGGGINRLHSIILMIATSEKGVVLIDEIDTGLHYSVLPGIWEGICRAAQAFRCQVIATTHSYECLQAAHDGTLKANMANDFRYIRLDRNQTTMVPKTYSLEMLEAALHHGWEVR